MIGRITLLSFAMLLGVVDSVEAQKLTLPVGVWGHDGPKGPDCKKPFLKIEEKRIIQRFDEGEGRCVVRNIKPRGKYISVKTKCDWDESVPVQLREGADDADDDAARGLRHGRDVVDGAGLRGHGRGVRGGVRDARVDVRALPHLRAGLPGDGGRVPVDDGRDGLIRGGDR